MATEANPFLAQVPQPVEQAMTFNDAEQVLDLLAAAIRHQLGDAGDATVERGFTTNLGVQHRLLIVLTKARFSDSLLEVYIPLAGFPAHVNPYDGLDWRVCADRDELQATLAALITEGGVHQRLQEIVNIAAG